MFYSPSEAEDACRRVAEQMIRELPEGKEKALVMARLAEAGFWARKAMLTIERPDDYDD